MSHAASVWQYWQTPRAARTPRACSRPNSTTNIVWPPCPLVVCEARLITQRPNATAFSRELSPGFSTPDLILEYHFAPSFRAAMMYMEWDQPSGTAQTGLPVFLSTCSVSSPAPVE